MKVRIVLSGPLCAGKTTVASVLERRLRASVLSVRDLLRGLADSSSLSREELQTFGERMETQTQGAWIANAVSAELEAQLLVVDAVRTTAQRAALSRLPGQQLNLHVTSNVPTRSARFSAREDRQFFEARSFELASRHPTEAGADDLAVGADIVLETSALPTHVMTEMAVDLVTRWVADTA